MDKKKLKLSISGNAKKTISNIEQAKSKPRNSVIIKNNKTFQKKKFFKTTSSESFKKPGINFGSKRSTPSYIPKKDLSDFEKRKLAEQRATKRLKGETTKENKEKSSVKKKRIKTYYFKSLK